MLPSQDFIILWISSSVNILRTWTHEGIFSFPFVFLIVFHLKNLEIHMHALSIVEQKHSEFLCKIMKINSPDSFSSMGRHSFLLLGVHLVIYKSGKSGSSRFISWLYCLLNLWCWANLLTCGRKNVAIAPHAHLII